jgi:hypothetical protein
MIDVVASVVKAMNLHQNMRYEIVNPDQSLFLFSITHVICVLLFVDVDGRIEWALMINVVASVVKAMNLHQNMR